MIHRPSIIAPRCRTCGGFTREWLRLNRRRAGFASWLHGACQCCGGPYWLLSPCVKNYSLADGATGSTDAPTLYFWLRDHPIFDGFSAASPTYQRLGRYSYDGHCYELFKYDSRVYSDKQPRGQDGTILTEEQNIGSDTGGVVGDAYCCRCVYQNSFSFENQDGLQPIPRYASVDISGAIHCCTMRIRNGPPQYFKGVGDPLNSSFLLEYQLSSSECQWGASFPFTYEVHGGSSCSNDPPFVFENAATLAITLRLVPHLNGSGLQLTAVVLIPSNDINAHSAFVTQMSGGPTPTHPFVGWGDAYSINNAWNAGVPCGYETTSGLDPNFVFTIFSRLGTATITFGN